MDKHTLCFETNVVLNRIGIIVHACFRKENARFHQQLFGFDLRRNILMYINWKRTKNAVQAHKKLYDVCNEEALKLWESQK